MEFLLGLKVTYCMTWHLGVRQAETNSLLPVQDALKDEQRNTTTIPNWKWRKKKTCFYMFHFQKCFFLKPIRNLKMRKKQHEITMMLTGSITITYKWSWLFSFENFPQDPWHKRDLCCHACDKTCFLGKLLGPNEIPVGENRKSYKTWFQNP